MPQRVGAREVATMTGLSMRMIQRRAREIPGVARLLGVYTFDAEEVRRWAEAGARLPDVPISEAEIIARDLEPRLQSPWRTGCRVYFIQDGGKENVVPITDEVRGIIDGLAMPDVGRLFPLSKFQVSRDRMAARKAAELEDFRLHDARHDFAQELENAGQGHFITDALHHSSPALRRRYAHARQDVIREAIETARGHTTGTRVGKGQ